MPFSTSASVGAGGQVGSIAAQGQWRVTRDGDEGVVQRCIGDEQQLGLWRHLQRSVGDAAVAERDDGGRCNRWLGQDRTGGFDGCGRCFGRDGTVTPRCLNVTLAAAASFVGSTWWQVRR